MPLTHGEISIVRAVFSAVQPFAEEALKERVKIVDYPDARWWQIRDPSDVVVGCLGLQVLDHEVPRAQIKGVYVVPSRRGAGFGTRATEAVIKLALSEGFTVEAVALNPAWYLARGFVQTGINPNGIAIVTRQRPASLPRRPQEPTR